MACVLADKGRTGVEVPLYMRRRSLFRIISAALHFIGIIHFIFAALYDIFATKVPVDVNPVYQAWAGQFKFLTYWNVVPYIYAGILMTTYGSAI